MRRLLTCLGVVLVPVLATAQTPGAIQSPAAAFVGKAVVGVQVMVEEQPTDDPSVRALVETPIGQPLSMAGVRESITHIFSLGRFEDVQVEAVEARGGVELRFHLVPLHNVARVDYVGNLGVAEDVLRQRVTLRFGALPPIGRAPEVARTLEQQIYPDLGYLHASVRWKQSVRHDPDRAFLRFDVESGPQATIGTVDVRGNPLMPVEAFGESVGAVAGGLYRPAEIRERLDGYVAKWKKKGRYEAVASFIPRPAPDGGVVHVAIEVQLGPVVKVAFEGDPLQKVKVADLVPLEREGSADEDLIEDSARRIATTLHSQGYWKASVTPSRREAEETLTVVFTIRKGLSYRIADAGTLVSGNTAVSPDELRPLLAKLRAGDVFIDGNLRAATAVLTGKYQALGYAAVKVEATIDELQPDAEGHGLVHPSIVVTPGPRTLIDEVRFEGNTSLPIEQIGAIVKSAPSGPYYVPQVTADRDAVLLDYLNAGFASASVDVVLALAPDGSRVDLTFRVTEGVQTIVDHILIIGNARTDQRVIERELLLRPGEPLGLEDVIESQSRLSALGLFRRVRITPISHGTAGRQDVLVAVEEGASTTFSYGGGVEVATRRRLTGAEGQAEDHLEFAPRGFIDVGRRNIGGKNRSVNFYSRLSLRPDVPVEGETDGSLFGFVEYRVATTYREPKAFGLNSDLTVTGLVEQGVRSSFNFARKGVGAELAHRLSPGVRVSGRYTFGTTRTFDEQLSEEDQVTLDRAFPEIRLSGFGGTISRDTRNDVVDPTRGAFYSADASVAARALGGQVGFMKTYTEGMWFRELPGRKKPVFAGRLALGLAKGFPRFVATTSESGETTVERVDDLPASERYFAGGGNTIRGFPLDGVGAPNTIGSNGLPIGGNAVIIMNAELRQRLFGDFGAAIFADGGNVFNRVNEFDLGELRGAVGFGLRYKSPFGAIRMDVGFKLDRRDVNGKLENRHDFHFSIGQAF